MLYNWESSQFPLSGSYSNLHFHMEKLQHRVRGKWKRHYKEIWTVYYLKILCENYRIWQRAGFKFMFLSPGICSQPQSPVLISAEENVQQSQTVGLASEYLMASKRGWVLEGNIIKHSNYLKPIQWPYCLSNLKRWLYAVVNYTVVFSGLGRTNSIPASIREYANKHSELWLICSRQPILEGRWSRALCVCSQLITMSSCSPHSF